MQETIYMHAENSTYAGWIAYDPETDDDGEPTDDAIFLWGKGERNELLEKAREHLALQDSRPGGAGYAHLHGCARAVFSYLGEESPS